MFFFVLLKFGEDVMFNVSTVSAFVVSVHIPLSFPSLPSSSKSSIMISSSPPLISSTSHSSSSPP
ncbi:hypothetical protein YC2023_059625 [Brassica napus]